MSVLCGICLYLTLIFAVHSFESSKVSIYSITLPMQAIFNYLVKKDGINSVEGYYPLLELLEKTIIRDELNEPKYRVFSSPEDFMTWYSTVPSDKKHCHEVIFGKSTQKLKFDIDAKADLLQSLSNEDLMFDSEESYTPENKIHFLMLRLIDEIVETFNRVYAPHDARITPRDIVITDSSRYVNGVYKYSYHVIITSYAVANVEEAYGFAKEILDNFPELNHVVDSGVYKNIQNFRILGSSKKEGEVAKSIVTKTSNLYGTPTRAGPKDLLITANYGICKLPIVYGSRNVGLDYRGSTIGDRTTETILKYLRSNELIVGQEYDKTINSLMCFQRTEPTFCKICEEIHHNDNTLMIVVSEVKLYENVSKWTLTGKCRHKKGSNALGSIIIDSQSGDRIKCKAGEWVVSDEDNDEDEYDEDEYDADDDQNYHEDDECDDYQEIEEKSDLDLLCENAPPKKEVVTKKPHIPDYVKIRIDGINNNKVDPMDSIRSAFESLPSNQQITYSENKMRSYELVPTLVVSAQMKLGKTKALREYIDTHFAESIDDPIIRFITFRQTFSASVHESFSDFDIYSEIKEPYITNYRHPRLIIQVESLHRIDNTNTNAPIDLLILDEVESILSQFGSGLHKNFNASYAMFEHLLRTASHVVCMDANISNRTYNTLNRIRSNFPITFHWNQYKRAKNDVYKFTKERAVWLSRLHEYVSDDKKVVIPINIKADAEAIELHLKDAFPKKVIMLYSSETINSMKKRHFGDVHKYWANLDVLIYTPTCSAGVSFELEHFDALFGYFCDTSCDVETCRQMIGRVRNLSTNEHLIYLRASGGDQPTTCEAIRNQIRHKRSLLYKSTGSEVMHFEYGLDGEVKFNETSYFELWLENERMNNLSKNGFGARFIDQVASTGASISLLIEAEGVNLGRFETIHSDAKSVIKNMQATAIAESREIVDEEASTIRMAMDNQDDVTPEDKSAYDKSNLRKFYNWDQQIDADFVIDYQDQGTKAVYKNLKKIHRKESVEESLAAVYKSECTNYLWSITNKHVEQNKELLFDRSKYDYRSLSRAVWIIKVCGFDLAKPHRIHERTLESQLKCAMPKFREYMDSIVYDFGVKKMLTLETSSYMDTETFLKHALKFINKIIKKVFGVFIRKNSVKSKTDIRTYSLAKSEIGRLFIISDDPDSQSSYTKPWINSNMQTFETDREQNNLEIFLDDAYYKCDLKLLYDCEVDLSEGS